MKLILKLRLLFSFTLFVLALGNPLLSSGQCSQNNFTVAGFELRDDNGLPFTVIDDYELGELVNGELWVMLGGSSTNGYNLRFYFDVYVNGVLTQVDQYECLFSGTQAVQGIWIKVRDFSWNWGDVIDIRNIFIHWDTGTAKANSTCTISDKNNINSQCYGNLQGFTAVVPLFPKFDFVSNGVCNTTIQFSNQTIGGTPPYNYSYSWDFDNDGLEDSASENPLFNFPSTGTYPIVLTVNDDTSITTITKDIFIDPNFGIQVTIFPTKIDESSGIIYVESVTGGTAPYSYFWTGPNGFTSTSMNIFNLSNGLYTLVVTDQNGCTQTVSYELDIAGVLNSYWRSIDLLGDRSAIKVSWEVKNQGGDGYFEIERGAGGIEDFSKIGSVQKINSIGETQIYHFSDTAIPMEEEMFYYRIVRKSGQDVDYSIVKMIRVEDMENKNHWIVYPNPSLGRDLNLKYLGKMEANDGAMILDVFNGGNYFQSLTFQNLNSETINLNHVFPNLPRGHLTLRISMGDEVQIVHVVN
ncbi:PKD domain-containing protein [Algoriphagus litoralis]|uniref:PKD domain-containing protein n=1 Tax=Algoriphagus litoralis TaxID=2202829 RepID=UPI0013005BB9|nr:PKD domain-containing protein [Algoriphagus litoralis]